MIGTAYYNEHDAYAAQWLRNLIAKGHIAPGDVDERSIEDVHPDDLRSYTQCHFFAGIGIWSYALRQAGWPDDRPVWTGSCPCQPFSAAGRGTGFNDERHLWPTWYRLIRELCPPVVFGEQVASAAAGPWVDLVQDDLEAVDYAFGALAFPAAGVGAPHIRDRSYWVAHATGQGLQGRKLSRQRGNAQLASAQRNGGVGGLAHLQSDRHQRAGQFCESAGGHGPSHLLAIGGVEHPGQHNAASEIETPGDWKSQADRPADQSCGSSLSSGGLADDELQQRPDGQSGVGTEHDQAGRLEGAAAPAGLRIDLRPGPVNGLWADADWLLCRDGKWRPVEPGTFPLAHGAAARVGRLRAYGNGLCAEAATVFVQAADLALKHLRMH